MRKFFNKIHLWLSICFGIIISIICFTGALLIFETEISEALCKECYFVKSDEGEPLSLDVLYAKVSETLPESVTITGVTVFDDDDRAYQFALSKPKKAFIAVDQYTGEVLPKYERLPFFNFVFQLHRWLLQPPGQGGMAIGKTIVGISTIVFVFILLSGIVLWVPKTKVALKNRLGIVVNKGWRRFWYDMHVSAGFYTLVILLSLALTGLTWSFQWYKNGFYSLFGAGNNKVENAVAANVKVASSDKGDVNNTNNVNKANNENFEKKSNTFAWQEAINEIEHITDDYDKIVLQGSTASVYMSHVGNQRAFDKYNFDSNGKITGIELYKNTSKAGKIGGWIYSIHLGLWGGFFSKIITCIAAIIGSTLPITGLYIWIKRLIAKKKNKQAKGIE